DLPVRLVGEYLPQAILAALPDRSGPARVTLGVDPVTREVAAPFVPASALASVDGTLSASLTLEADKPSLDAVRGELVLDRGELSIGGVPIRLQRPTRVAIEGSRARIEDWEWGGAATRISLGGSATLSANPALDLSADANLDLRLLSAFVQGVSTAGTARVA